MWRVDYRIAWRMWSGECGVSGDGVCECGVWRCSVEWGVHVKVLGGEGTLEICTNTKHGAQRRSESSFIKQRFLRNHVCPKQINLLYILAKNVVLAKKNQFS